MVSDKEEVSKMDGCCKEGIGMNGCCKEEASLTKKEQIVKLKQYKSALESEAKAVEKKIKELGK